MRQEFAEFDFRQPHQFAECQNAHDFLHQLDRANRGLLTEADGGGGCTACGRNAVEECLHLQPPADERCEMAGMKDGLGVIRLEETGIATM